MQLEFLAAESLVDKHCIKRLPLDEKSDRFSNAPFKVIEQAFQFDLEANWYRQSLVKERPVNFLLIYIRFMY